MKRESVNCAICGKDKTKLLYVVDSFHIVRCSNCGLIYVNPRLSSDELKRIYDSQDYYRSGYPNYLSKKKFIFWESKKILEKIERLRKQKGERILDIGCSFGFFLDSARELGWDTYGVEISKYASDFARKELHLNVTTGTINDLSYSNNSFDVITMWDVIEHLYNPVSSLKKIRDLLKPDGILALATPNIGSPLSRLTKERWEQIKPTYHLYYFSPATLTKLLEKSRLSMVKLSTQGLGGTLKWIMGRNGLQENEMAADSSRVKYLLKNGTNKFAEIFGMGEKIVAYAKK